MLTRNMLKIGLVGLLALLLVLVPLMGACAAEEEEEVTEVTLFAAGFGSSAYLMGVGMAELVNEKSTWLHISAIENAGTAASIEQMNARSLKDRSCASCGEPTITWAIRGFGKYEGDAHPDLRYIALQSCMGVGFWTFDSDIKTVDDIIGKKVGVGSKGSSVGDLGDILLRDCWGIYDQVDVQYLGHKGVMDALRDGLIDVGIFFAAMVGPGEWAPHQLMLELVGTRDMHYIGLTEEQAERGRELSGFAYAAPVIPAGALGEGQPSEPVMVMAMLNPLMCYADVPDDVTYEMARIFVENYERFADMAASGPLITPDTLAWLPAASEEYVHPGALSYYEEAGVLISIAGASPWD